MSPKWAPTHFDLENRAGASTHVRKVSATIGPTPGADATADGIQANNIEQHPMKFLKLDAQSGARLQERADNGIDNGMAAHQFSDTLLKPHGANHANLQSKIA